MAPAPTQNNQLPIANRDDLCCIDLDLVKPGAVTDFSLYIDIGGHMVLYAAPDYEWNREEITRLRRDGHTQLYYEATAANQVDCYKRVSLIEPVDDSLPPATRIEHITQIAGELSQVLSTLEITSTTMAKSQQLAESMVECVLEQPSCIAALRQLHDSHRYTYLHSGRVAAFSVAIAVEMGQSQESELHNIALGGLLHDIGKAKIETSILEQPGPLSDKQWRQMRQHTLMGLQMLGDSQLELVPREIILHHHERDDGRGYPHGLGPMEIMDEVKIAAFADIFDALTSNRPYQKTRSRYEALDFIRFNLLESLSSEVYKALVALLNRSGDG